MHTLKILSSQYLTHDVKRFVLEKPKDFFYRPGQAAYVSINKPGWDEQKRPFSFTSLNDWPYLEFTIKIYNDHEGVTQQLGSVNDGEELILHEVFDSFDYKGPGIFIAGGTGITPFIAIFRALFLSGNLRNVGLIYSNKSQDDIILGEELYKLLGPAYINIFTRQGVIGFKERHIDKTFLIELIKDFNQRFYVCGPANFTTEISQHLLDLGAKPESIIV